MESAITATQSTGHPTDTQAPTTWPFSRTLKEKDPQKLTLGLINPWLCKYFSVAQQLFRAFEVLTIARKMTNNLCAKIFHKMR